MNEQYLIIKYHPAKKEIEFHRFQGNKEIPIRNDSRLTHYSNMKGKFILQDYGNSFFDDIAKVFDGITKVEIKTVMTKLDYEDFQQMIEFYNQEDNKVKISSTMLAELPNMQDAFLEVKKYGEEAISILSTRKQGLFEIPLNNDDVKERAESFAKDIDKQIGHIKEKITSLVDDTVNLCFTGVFSAGKSALINAILGYRILPEAMKSETAKMMEIKSPRKDEKIRIEFVLCNEFSEIDWNENGNCFEFVKGPSENSIRTDIQNEINRIKDNGDRQHEQIRQILKKLNDCEEIASRIKIYYPISLDNENVKFTIYDTPGTDSNHAEHKAILNKALENQSQSILIFVAKPNGLEGEGNNALLNYLKDAEQKTGKTSIDLARSIFVINYADSATANQRKELQYSEIKYKDDDSFSIKLSDKKLFFISALYGTVAKSIINKVDTDADKGFLESGKVMFSNESHPMGYCFRQNKFGTSELATKNLIEKCNVAIKEAEEKNDEVGKLLVCSGLYALEEEIKVYGEKYASAVKAFAIIDTVDKILSNLVSRTNSLTETNQDDIKKVESNIKELENTINMAIEKEYEKTSISTTNEIPMEFLKPLGLDSDSLNSLVGNTKNELDKLLKKWFFGIAGKVLANDKKDKKKELVKNIITSTQEVFKNKYIKGREELLKIKKDEFINSVDLFENPSTRNKNPV